MSTIDLSTMPTEHLHHDLELMRTDLQNAQLAVAEIETDIRAVEEELKKRE